MYKVIYVENRKESARFYGGLLDCRYFLLDFLLTHGIEHYVESPNIIKTRGGFFRVEEVDFEKELDRLRSLAYTLDISSNLLLDWERHASLEPQGRRTAKLLR